MEVETKIPSRPEFKVKATFHLTSETHSITKCSGSLSEQLVAAKEESMFILKDFITRHNVSIDVPDELVEGSEEEDDDDDVIPEKPLKKQK